MASTSYGGKKRKYQTGPTRYKKQLTSFAPSRRRSRNIQTAAMLGIENKFLDSEKTATNLTQTITAYAPTTGSIGCLSAVAQGDTENERDGRKYTMNSIHIRGAFYLSSNNDQSDAQLPAIVRLAVVIDTQTNGAALTASEVFLPATTAAQNVFSFRNLQYSNRFIVLSDKSYTINPVAGAGTGAVNDFSQVIKQFKLNFMIPPKAKMVDTKATAGNVTSITSNSIHLLAWANQATDVVTLQYNSRLRFVG